jgi:DNA ligase-1
MLACNVGDINNLQFPVLATPKLDGIRCLIINGRALSRKFIEIPNKYIQQKLSQLPDGFDGEIICPNKTFNETQSLVMSEDGEPEFAYFVFDWVKDSINTPYQQRVEQYISKVKELGIKNVVSLEPMMVKNINDLNVTEEVWISAGYEGVMVRSINSPYKCGRSTVKEQYLLKIKRFEDSEATIISFNEKMINNNEATIDELGNTKRSSHKENLIPANTLGSITVKDINTDVVFDIGTGFNDEQRKLIWEQRSGCINQIITYTFQPSGMKEKPRFPVYKGFRNVNDL